MGIVVLGIAIAEIVTKKKVENLKRQINDIVNQHKAISDKLKKISEDLQKLDMKQLSEKLNKMNQSLTQNLRTILTDQQGKLDMLKNIDPTRTGVDPQTLLSGILEGLNFVSTVFTLVEVMCATNPATIAISGVMLVLNSILSIFSLINNIKEISELNQKKGELEEYFKPGGQFEQHKRSITTLAFQVIQNFYMVVVNFKSIINELTINVTLLSLSKKSTQLNYKHYLQLLQSNPFDDQFQQTCLQTYKNFISIQDYQLDQKVNMSCKYLEDFENNYDVVGRLHKVSQIAGCFGSGSEIGRELERASGQVKKLTRLRIRFEKEFEKRNGKSKEQLLKSDKELLEDLLDEARKMDEEKLSIVQVVSFFTRQFYGDDPLGWTLFKMDLEKEGRNTEYLSNLGVNSRNQNVIILPRPIDPYLTCQWQSNRSTLQKLYQSQHPTTKYFIKNLYIRMQTSQFQLNNQTKSKLIYFYGLTIQKFGQIVEDCIQMQAGTSPALWAYGRMVFLKGEEVQVKVWEDQDLDALCCSLCFFINGIAYPERVVNFNIQKVDAKYKAILQWRKSTSKPKFFGKFIKYDIQENHEIHEEDQILYSSKIGLNNSVVFRIK